MLSEDANQLNISDGNKTKQNHVDFGGLQKYLAATNQYVFQSICFYQ